MIMIESMILMTQEFSKVLKLQFKFFLPRFQTTALSAAPSTIQAHGSLSGVENKNDFFLDLTIHSPPFQAAFHLQIQVTL